MCKRCEADYQIVYRKTHPDYRKRPNQYQLAKGDPVKLAKLNARRREQWQSKYKQRARNYLDRMRNNDYLKFRVRFLRYNISKDISREWIEKQ